MTASLSTFKTAGEQASIPAWLVRVCLVLAVANVALCLSAFLSRMDDIAAGHTHERIRVTVIPPGG